MELSFEEIERCSLAVLRDYTGSDAAKSLLPLNVDAFARDYLGLQLAYTRLSNTGNVLGLTTYADTEVELHRYCRIDKLRVAGNTILVDESLAREIKERGRRRYTVAHECAHHIFRRMKDAREESAPPRPAYDLYTSPPEKTAAERSANALAAALLMPQNQIGVLMSRFARERKLISFEGRFNIPDKLALTHICSALELSRAAVTIRLRQLGYLILAPLITYTDPVEVVRDE